MTRDEAELLTACREGRNGGHYTGRSLVVDATVYTDLQERGLIEPQPITSDYTHYRLTAAGREALDGR